jgi:hypothetical protein
MMTNIDLVMQVDATQGRGSAGACAVCPRQDQKGLRIFLRDTEPLESIARRLSPPADQSGSGDIALVLRFDMQTESSSSRMGVSRWRSRSPVRSRR